MGTKKKTSLLTKDMEKRVAYAISVFMGDTEPSYVPWRHAAKTVLAAYVVGQTPALAAQRLLSWDCIDCGLPEQDLSAVSLDRGEPFIRTAFGGYHFLNGVEA